MAPACASDAYMDEEELVGIGAGDKSTIIESMPIGLGGALVSGSIDIGTSTATSLFERLVTAAFDGAIAVTTNVSIASG